MESVKVKVGWEVRLRLGASRSGEALRRDESQRRVAETSAHHFSFGVLCTPYSQPGYGSASLRRDEQDFKKEAAGKIHRNYYY